MKPKNKKDKNYINLKLFLKDVIKFCKSKTAISLTTLCSNYGISKSYATILIRMDMLYPITKKGKLTIYENKNLSATNESIEMLKSLLKKYNKGKSTKDINLLSNPKIKKSLDEFLKKEKNENKPFIPIEKSEADIEQDIKQLNEALEEINKLDLSYKLPHDYVSGMFKRIKELEIDNLIIQLAKKNQISESLETIKGIVKNYNDKMPKEKQISIVDKVLSYNFDQERANLQTKIDKLNTDLSISKAESEIIKNELAVAKVRHLADIKVLESEISRYKTKLEKERGILSKIKDFFSGKK